jgi:hypothetical protein
MNEERKTSEQKIPDDLKETIKETVIARLDVLPADKKISIGSYGDFTKSELIEHVKEEDEVGQKVVDLELTFLKALKEGTLLKEILTSEEK